MKKILKIVLALAVVAVLLLVVGVFALIAAIDSVAKKGIEAGGTYAMGVPTTLKSADIGLFSGNFGLSGLSIANPPGYKGQQFFLLGEGKLALSLAAMQGDVITRSAPEARKPPPKSDFCAKKAAALARR